MAYHTEELFEKAIAAIKGNKLFFMNDVHAYIGIHKSTFYDHFPSGSNRHKEIEDALIENRTTTRHQMRNKWYKSDNATLQIALYRLIAPEEEHRKLAQQYVDHTSDGDKIPTIDLSQLSDQAKDAIYEQLTNNPEEGSS